MVTPETLRRYPYFSGADEESLEAIALISTEITCTTGEVLFRDGEAASHCYIVVSG